MAKRRNITVAVEPSEETATIDNATGEVRKKRNGVYVPLTTNDELDLSRVKENAEIDRARNALKISAVADFGAPGPISERRVELFLKMHSKACATIVPMVLKKKSNGQINIPGDLANRVYTFSDSDMSELKMLGMEAAKSMPQWLLDIIGMVGPGTEFLAQLGMITYFQTVTLIDEWKKSHPMTVEAETKIPDDSQQVN